VNIFYREFALVLCLLSLLQSGRLSAETNVSEKIKTCVIDSDLFPLWQAPRKEHSQFPGINIELFNQISKQLKFEIDWVRAPFARCLALLSAGEVDIVNAASFKTEREKFGLYPRKRAEVDTSKRLKYDTYKAFVRQNSQIAWDGNKFENLQQGLLLIEIGASIGSLLKNLDLNVQEIASVDRSFLMLSLGRAEVVVTNAYNRPNNLDNIRIVSPEIISKPYYLMISTQFYRQNPDLSERMWQASAELQAEQHDIIVERYRGKTSWDDLNNLAK
jgi:polar amino acid transport system substrate-binding protein